MENREVDAMEKQTVTSIVETKNGIVNRIGKAYIVTPRIGFRGGEVSWLADKFKIPVHGMERKKWERS